MDNSVPISEIAETILEGTVLDVFFIIGQHENIYKSSIIQKFIESDERANSKHSTYRSIVDIAIAKIEGARFISSFKSGQKDLYYLTPYGKTAGKMLPELFEHKPEIKRNSILVDKVLN